jgi:hypothetical protein
MPARETARQLVGELAANAALHAATSFTVVLLAEANAVTIEVQDRSPLVPVALSTKSFDDSGRGLHIVDDLADEWGSSAVGARGKTVWARIYFDTERAGETGPDAHP